MATATLYQLDYRVTEVGKNRPESKKEVNFDFNLGGKDYKMDMYWSHSSGKYSVDINGCEHVHFGKKPGFSVLDEKFSFEDINFHVLGTRTAPKGSDQGFSCFELIVDGVLLSACPHMNNDITPSQFRTLGGSILDLLYPNHPCRKAPVVNQVDQRNDTALGNRAPVVAQTPPPAPVADLLSFDAPAAEPMAPQQPVAQQAQYGAPPHQQQYAAPQQAPGAVDLFGAPPSAPEQPTSQQPLDLFGALQQPASHHPVDLFGVPPAAAPQQPAGQYPADPFGGAQPASQPTAQSFGAPQQQPAGQYQSNPFGAQPAAQQPQQFVQQYAAQPAGQAAAGNPLGNL